MSTPQDTSATRAAVSRRLLDVERLTDAIEQEILATRSIARTGKVLEVIGTLVKVGASTSRSASCASCARRTARCCSTPR